MTAKQLWGSGYDQPQDSRGLSYYERAIRSNLNSKSTLESSLLRANKTRYKKRSELREQGCSKFRERMGVEQDDQSSSKEDTI